MTDGIHQPGGPIVRLVRALRLFRPRTVAELGKADQRLQQQIDRLTEETRLLRTALGAVARRELQLRTVVESEYGADDLLARFEAIVHETPLSEHIRSAIAAAPVRVEPFPHSVADNLLPLTYYEELVAALPSPAMLTERPASRQYLTVPFEFAPRYSIEVWRHMALHVADGIIKPAVVEKLQASLTTWLRDRLPAAGDRPLERIRMRCSESRIVLQQPGDDIPAFNDSESDPITCVVHLSARKDDALGNRGFFVLNTTRATRTAAPPDTAARGDRRYAYVFSIGPDQNSIPPAARM